MEASANTGKVYNWALQRTESRFAPLWIALLFTLEIILFIPLDAILMFFCLQNRKRMIPYIGIAALASTLSSLSGYLIGHLLWDFVGPYVVPYLLSPATFARFSFHFEAHQNLAVFAGSILPFPLKALSLTAGVFHLALPYFLAFVFLARALRFSLLGGAIHFWGADKIKVFVQNNFHRLVLLIGAKVAIGFLLVWAIAT